MSLEGIEIKHTKPAPKGRRKWPDFFERMKIDDHFYADTEKDRRAVLMAAKRYGVAVRSEKLTAGGFEIWRIA
jgi:hypothetical protein